MRLASLVWRVILIETQFAFVRMRSYPVKMTMDCLVFYLIFTGLAFGVRAIAPYPVPGAELAAAIAGYLLWFAALHAVDAMGHLLAEDAQTGTLEQVCLSSLDPRLILFGRFASQLIAGLVMIAAVLLAVVLTTGTTLELNPVTVPLTLAVVVVTAIGLSGLGYLVACLILLYKRLGNFLTLVQFGLLFAVLTPPERVAPPLGLVLEAIPIVPASQLLAPLFAGGGTLSLPGFGQLLAVSGAWFLCGWLVFPLALRVARANGLLGHY